MSRRVYDNSQREVAAATTRARILESAHDLLVTDGYSGLSIAALARSAGVSPQTIYNSIGGKPDVLKACYDVTLAGDADQVPMSERADFRAIWEEADASGFVRSYAAWCRTLLERVAPILGPVLRPGAVTDEAVASFVLTIDAERRIGTTHAIAHLRKQFGLPAGLSSRAAVDLTWTLNSPEVYHRLVHTCGWKPATYQRWLEGQLAAALID